MKAVNYISFVLLLVLGSCSSGLYTGLEYDDLYYLPSDKPIVQVQPDMNKQIAEADLKAEEYYDNIYAADTLVSDEYSDATGNDEAVLNENKGAVNNYYLDDYSYSGRLRRFYGNYFYPYWRDPFYSSWGWPSLSFNYGFPSYYDPFWYDSFSYDPFYSYGYYGSYYSPWSYGGYYSPFYSSYYSPYYSNWGYMSNFHYRDYDNSINYGRRDRQSVYSTNWNERVQPSASTRRESSYVSKGLSPDGTRRSLPTTVNNREVLNSADRKTDQTVIRDVNTPVTRTTTTRSTTVTKPEYNTVNRTYTPSYSNPRMTTRPSYNNSRVGTENTATYNRTPVNTNQAASSGKSRSVPSYNSSGNYSAPSRRSSSNVYSSPSYGSSSRSTYSGSSSGGSSRSSSSSSGYSGGSSSGGSSSGSSSSSSRSSSSGGRR